MDGDGHINEDHGDGVNTCDDQAPRLWKRKRKIKWAQGKDDMHRAIFW
jgi:hypothetical protein